MTESKRLIVVIGATGSQGRGVVSALLGPPVSKKFSETHEYAVKAVTRSVDSKAAKALKADFPSVEVVPWDPNDIESLKSVFKGAYAVFSVTSTFSLPCETEEQIKTEEVKFGKRIADAAQASAVTHFIFSSLPSLASASKNKFAKGYHFENKFAVGTYLSTLSMSTTLLIPGLFYTNYTRPAYARRNPISGDLELISTANPARKMGFLDPSHDMGVFTRAALDKGPPKGGIEEYVVEAPNRSYASLAEALATRTKSPVNAVQITSEEYQRVSAGEHHVGVEHIVAVDVGQMAAWFAEAPDDGTAYGLMGAQELEKAEKALGVKASTWEEFLDRLGPLGI